MFFRNRCYNGGNHHKFEPRYDECEEMPNNFSRIQGTDYLMIKSLKTMTTTYVKDVCVWCGKEIRK